MTVAKIIKTLTNQTKYQVAESNYHYFDGTPTELRNKLNTLHSI